MIAMGEDIGSETGQDDRHGHGTKKGRRGPAGNQGC